MSFASLAELLPGVAAIGETDQRKLVAAVLLWLEQCQEPWQLIVDNADDLAMVQPYLPLKGNGSVLLTTRTSAAGWRPLWKWTLWGVVNWVKSARILRQP